MSSDKKIDPSTIKCTPISILTPSTPNAPITCSEWVENNSLTSREDFDRAKIYKPRTNLLPFSDKTLEREAIDALTIKDGIHNFPMIDSRFCDPDMQEQMVGLFSWVPAKGATPNKDGVYGMIKLRGNFTDEDKANIRSEYLIKNVDTYHKIYHVKVGQPYPLTANPQFVKNTIEVKMQELVADYISADVKKMREEDLRQKKEIADRERKVLEHNEKMKKEREEKKHEPEPDEDPKDKYTTLRVKRAQIIHTYLRTRDKLQELREIIVKTRKEYEEMEKTDDSYKKDFFERYMFARKQSGLEVPTDLANDASFLKFLAEDRVKELDFDEHEEIGVSKTKPNVPSMTVTNPPPLVSDEKKLVSDEKRGAEAEFTQVKSKRKKKIGK